MTIKDAKLIVVKGAANKQEIPVDRFPFTIGRTRKACLPIGHTLVSRDHCEIFCRDGHLIVRDTGSSNGTMVNGMRVFEQQLAPEDVLTVGPLTFVVRYQTATEPIANVEIEEEISATQDDSADGGDWDEDEPDFADDSEDDSWEDEDSAEETPPNETQPSSPPASQSPDHSTQSLTDEELDKWDLSENFDDLADLDLSSGEEEELLPTGEDSSLNEQEPTLTAEEIFAEGGSMSELLRADAVANPEDTPSGSSQSKNKTPTTNEQESQLSTQDWQSTGIRYKDLLEAQDKQGYHFHLQLPDATGIEIGTRVHVAGINVGSVVDLSWVEVNDVLFAQANIELEDRLGKVMRADAKIQVKHKKSKTTIEIRSPGKDADNLPPGGTIRLPESSDAP